MTCETALLLLSGHIDGVNTEAEEAELRAHLSECADCRAILAAYEQADAGLKQLETQPPEGFARGVMYRIGQQTGTEKKPRRRFIGPGTGIGLVAAMLVLLLGTGLIKLPKLADKAATAEAPMAALSAMPAETALYGGAEAAEEVEKAASKADGAYWINENKDMEPMTGSALRAAEPSLQAAEPTEPSPQSEGMELCKQLNAPVLRYAEFGTELIEVAQKYAPALGERLAALTPERVGGELRYETDTRTVLALHEWLLEQLPRSEDDGDAVFEAETGIILRTQELDPDFGFLAEIVTLPEVPERILWPESWSPDWPERFRLEQSWELCFPDEKKLPKGSDRAYLVLEGQ